MTSARSRGARVFLASLAFACTLSCFICALLCASWALEGSYGKVLLEGISAARSSIGSSRMLSELLSSEEVMWRLALLPVVILVSLVVSNIYPGAKLEDVVRGIARDVRSITGNPRIVGLLTVALCVGLPLALLLSLASLDVAVSVLMLGSCGAWLLLASRGVSVTTAFVATLGFAGASLALMALGLCYCGLSSRGALRRERALPLLFAASCTAFAAGLPSIALLLASSLAFAEKGWLGLLHAAGAVLAATFYAAAALGVPVATLAAGLAVLAYIIAQGCLGVAGFLKSWLRGG